jgi:predicted O-methyltransferase YrrM
MGLWSKARVLATPGGREIIRLHRQLEGMIALREAAWLYRAARKADRIVEVGSYRGKSAVIMARGAMAAGRTGARITAIDPHLVGNDSPRFGFGSEDREALLRAVRAHGVERMIEEMVMTSAEARAAWNGEPIDLLWIDGDHSYEAAKHDFEKWGELVRVGGTIAAHDHAPRFPGVIRAWQEAIAADPRWRPRGKVRSLVWAERVIG